MAKKNALGKGLSSLMGGADAEVMGMSESVSELPIKNIRPNKGQPRKNFDEVALQELADSIKANGVLQPILVRPVGSKYEIVAGERRYQAAKLAGLTDIPVQIRDVSDQEVFQLALIENLQRSDLSPIEEAQGYQKLIKDNGFTQEEVGKVVSKSRSAIANSLRLLDLPKEIQDMMTEGVLSAGHARAILAVPSDDARLQLAHKVVNENLTVRQTENLAPLFSGRQSERPHREPTPQAFKRAARQLKLALDTNVKVSHTKNKNKIEIEFKDEDELARLVNSLLHVQMSGRAEHEES